MKRNTFTLIEILGVIAIIAILATLGFAGYSYANNKSRESATQGLITRLNAAFEFAHQKTGFLPPSNGFVTISIDDDHNVTIPLPAGVTAPTNGTYTFALPGTPNRLERMHTEFCKQFIKALEMDSMNRFMENNVVIDAWGNPVRFRYPGKFKTGGFDLIAAGSDGGFGADAAEDPVDNDVSKYRDGADWICDDIANF